MLSKGFRRCKKTAGVFRATLPVCYTERFAPAGYQYICGMEYFGKLLQLLQLERAEDEKTYTLLAQTTSVAVRRSMGLAWYPVTIRGTEPGRGDYLVVEVERTTHHDMDHQLRFGVSAALFSHHDPQANRVTGTVTYQSGNKLKITLRTDELPDWADDGKLGIDLLFDDNSYEEMQAALRQAATLADKPEGRLVNVLTGNRSPEFEAAAVSYAVPELNPSQQEAVQKILQATDLAIVHGPPGTGKTTTLVQAIRALVKQSGVQVLVTAPSNAAVDLLSERLSDAGLTVLRVGNPAKVSEKLMSLTLDSQVAAHPANKQIRALKRQASEYRDMAHKYKRNFGKAEREQRKALFEEAYKIMKEAGRTEQYIVDDLLQKAQVVAATLVGANHYTVKHKRYAVAVIDEAGQALEPASWIPVLKARKLVLAGDHCQLPPTIKSAQAAREGLATTLLEKCTALFLQAVVLLEEQYRMNEAIMQYSSDVFYGSRLKAHYSVASHTLDTGDSPVSFIDTAGCGFEEKQEGTSVTNPEEAVFLFRHLERLVEQLAGTYNNNGFPSIAVISPYKQQVNLMKELLANSPLLMQFAAHISVNTIDSFQGQERDVVYISLVRSNSGDSIGFLSDTRRMNVAMTRARKRLVVIGDSATLAQHPFYNNFIAYTQQRELYASAWEFME